jgi:type II secretory pathway pseudopilin PulG
MPRDLRHSRAFTVTEALAAGMILAISALIVGPSVSGALVGLEDARDLQRAAQLLDETLTRIDLIGPDRVAREGPLTGQFEPPDDRFTWQTEIEPTVPGNLYKVTVRVSWTGPRGPHSAAVQTLLNDAAGSHDATLEWRNL